jgi:hypothetical protein
MKLEQARLMVAALETDGCQRERALELVDALAVDEADFEEEAAATCPLWQPW